MIRNYIKTALRGFWRHKLFTLINVIGLSIGVSAALIIYLIVHFDLNFDKFHKDGDRIYRVVTNFRFSGQPAYNSGVCGPLPGAIKNGVTGIKLAVPCFRMLLPDVYISQEKARSTRFKEQPNILITTPAYFDLIKYNWVRGSAKTALSNPYQVVLTTDQAKLYFPELSFDQIMGKAIIYNTVKTTITGIIEPLKENSGFSYHDFISYSTALADSGLKANLRLDNWGGTSAQSQLFIKLFPNSKAALVEKQLNDILKQNLEYDKDKTQELALQKLTDIHLGTQYGGIANYDAVANKTTLNSLLVIAAFLLLLGCINFVNLTTAQATQRAKEIGIRKTMGSSRAQLITQFLSETFVVAIIAVIISVLLAPFLIKLFGGFIDPRIRFDLINQPHIILFLLILTVTVSLLSGIYPAIILSGYKPVSVLKDQAQFTSSNRNAWMRKSLTVTQFVVAQFFVMATLLVGKQIYYATHKDLGFRKDGIVVVNSPWKNHTDGKNQVFLNKLRAMPQIELAALGHDEPSSDNTSSTEATYIDEKKVTKIEVSEKFGDENYINLYRIKLLAGRNIQKTDSGRAFLVNLTYTKILGFKKPGDAIGKAIDNFDGDTRMQIIGVVSDFHQESLHASIVPLAIIYPEKGFNTTFHIALKPQTMGGKEWSTALAGMGQTWRELYPEDEFAYQFVNDTVAKFYQKEQQTATLLNWATGLSILISCLGLLGLTMYITNQRTKEIGVRKVLGASVIQIMRLLSSELVSLVILAFLVVTPVAWWILHKWIQSFADRTPISWWIFAFSGGIMLVMALVTSSIQTANAALANPVKSLKNE
jgi:putative ABC transport system permease protein